MVKAAKILHIAIKTTRLRQGTIEEENYGIFFIG